ncbi:MAG: DivIVA domain-containing protein [Christensenellales bacterium]|jgi:cell division septum initiation protein DivIVA
MNNLKKSIMGKYNAEDVDLLLLKVRNDYEKCLKEQKERLFELREQNSELSTIIGKYRDNERYIIGAITKAEEAAQTIISEAEQKAKERIERVRNEEKQIRLAAEGCYQRLSKLKRASETIYKAVARVMGEYEEEERVILQNNIRPIKNLYDGTNN